MGHRRTDSSDARTPRGSGSGAARSGRAPANALEAAEARARRVAELRAAVAAGTYRPDAREVAAALLRSRARRALFGDGH